MKNKVLSLLSAAVLVLALGSMAKADTFNLTTQNGGLPAPAPAFCAGGTVDCWGYVTVTGNNGATGNSTVTITFVAATGYEFHNNGVGFNIGTLDGGDSISNYAVSCTPYNGATCPSTVSGSGQLDGFGSFGETVGGIGNGSSSGQTQVVITITGTDLDLADFEGSNGTAQFAAQVAPQGSTGCTGYVGNEGGSSTATGGATCGTTSVPEPGSLALFGTGILGMAGYLRRKLLS